MFLWTCCMKKVYCCCIGIRRTQLHISTKKRECFCEEHLMHVCQNHSDALICLCLVYASWNSTMVLQQIQNALQVNLWLSVTYHQCHDFRFSICQEKSTVSLNHKIAPNIFVSVSNVRKVTFIHNCSAVLSEDAKIKSGSLTDWLTDWQCHVFNCPVQPKKT